MQGVPEASYRLAFMYTQGDGVEQNYNEAARLFEFAAENGNSGAQYLLGRMFHTGQGVEQDYRMA